MKKSTYREKIGFLLSSGITELKEDEDGSSFAWLYFTHDARWAVEEGDKYRFVTREEALALLQKRQEEEDADTAREAAERSWLQDYYNGLPD